MIYLNLICIPLLSMRLATSTESWYTISASIVLAINIIVVAIALHKKA